jgi:GcrA cell cycle regulator
MSKWTDDREERLKALWTGGWSASQIAGQLGGISRNAVIGKVHRLGLSGRQGSPRRCSMPRRALAVAGPKVAASAAAAGELPLRPAARVTLPALKDKMCRFPLGDPGDEDFGFCGRRTGGSSYCGHHARIAYQPAQPRRLPVRGGC